MSSNDTGTVTVAIEILNDNVTEVNETFRVDLSIIGNNSDNCVLLQPNSVEVLILDNDGMFMIQCIVCSTIHKDVIPPVAKIGFDSRNYTIIEGESTFLFITLKLIYGQLGREVMSTLTYKSDTATSLILATNNNIVVIYAQFMFCRWIRLYRYR